MYLYITRLDVYNFYDDSNFPIPVRNPIQDIRILRKWNFILCNSK